MKWKPHHITWAVALALFIASPFDDMIYAAIAVWWHDKHKKAKPAN